MSIYGSYRERANDVERERRAGHASSWRFWQSGQVDLRVTCLEELCFQSAEEAFARCVVLRGAFAGHRANQLRSADPVEPARPAIVGSAIGMDDWPLFAVVHGPDGCIQHGMDKTRIWFGSDGPVDDGRKVHFASWDLELGDVCKPLHVRRFCMKSRSIRFSGAGLITNPSPGAAVVAVMIGKAIAIPAAPESCWIVFMMALPSVGSRTNRARLWKTEEPCSISR